MIPGPMTRIQWLAFLVLGLRDEIGARVRRRLERILWGDL